MSKFNVWMYDQFGYKVAIFMIGNYNVVQVMGERMAMLIGCTFDYVEEIK